MTSPPRAQKIHAAGGMSGRQFDAEVRREVAVIQEQHKPHMPTGRCRVCQHPESRSRVNKLLGYGMREAEILEFVEDLNEKRPKNGKITYDSIRNHRQRHFNVQEATQAGYRRILEKRKAALVEEFGEGAATLLTGAGFLEIIANKGFQHAIDDNTIVPYMDGLQAQLKLEEMAREGAVEEQIAQMRRDVALLQQAVKDVAEGLPDGEGERMLRDITDRIDELTGNAARRNEDAEVIDAEVVSGDDFYDQDDDDDVGFSPTIEADLEDPLGED